MSRRLRFAVLCGNGRLRAWQVKCLDRLRASDGAELVLMITGGGKPVPPRPWSEFVWRLYCRHARDGLPALARIDALQDVGTTLHQAAIGDPGTIRSYRLDFILHFGGGSSEGLATAAEHGIWSFSHDYEDDLRALAASFEEVRRARPTTCVALHKVGCTGANVLQRAVLATHWHLPTNHDRMLSICADLCLRACRELAAGASERHGPAASSVPTIPTNAKTFAFLIAQTVAWLRVRLRRTLVLDDWAIGIVDESVEELRRRGSLGEVAWYGTGRRRTYVADPMPLASAVDSAFLAEHFDYDGSAKGSIARCAFGVGGRLSLTPVLEPEHHLSYPFILEHEGQRYVIPESHEVGTVDLYALDPDGTARPVRRLLDLAVSDPTLLRWDGRWWLFCAEGSLKLLAFHAEALDAPWTPHRLNPLKIDVTASRPAGPLFERDGALYRPAQDCAASYGSAVVLHRIVELTPDRFAEEEVGRIGPARRGPYREGVHTLHVLGDRCLVDGKRSVLDPSWLLRGRAHGRKVRLRHARLAAAAHGPAPAPPR